MARSNWYNSSWNYRIPVTIDNSSTAYGLSYLAVGINISGSSYTSLHAHANGDYSDIRVTDSDGVTLLNHWLEDTANVASTVMLLVKVPQIPASTSKTIYVYYGNAGATTVSNAANTVKSSHIPTLSTLPSVTIDNTASVFNGPGSLGVASNGNLVCVYNSSGTLNYGHNGGAIFSTISTDGGATWSARSTILSGAANVSKTIRTIATTKLASNNLICAIANDTDSNLTSAIANVYVLVSTDNGANWSIGTAITTPAGCTIAQPYGTIIETSNGDLWWMWQVTRSGGDTKNSSIIMRCPSGSDPLTGSNWVFLGGSLANATVFRDAAQSLSYNESDVVMLTSTRFLAAAREDTNKKLRYSVSNDTGATWSAPANITDIGGLTTGTGVAPQLIKLANGDVICKWGERTAAITFFGVGASITTDGGTTWSPFALPMMINGTHDCSYASTAQNPDGTLTTVVEYSNGLAGAGTTATFYAFKWDEDWLANPYAWYDDSEGAGMASGWTLGANAAQDATLGHSGSKSLKLNNNTSGGGTGATALLLIGNQSVGYQKKTVCINFWKYVNQDAAAGIFTALKDGTTVGTTGSRILTNDIAGTTPFATRWYNGTAYGDWTNAQTVAASTWYKYKLKGKTTSNSAITAGLAINNTLAGDNATNAFNGTNNYIDRFYLQAGSTGSTNAALFHVDDVYVSQWVATDPTVTAGAEQPQTIASYYYHIFSVVAPA